MQCALPVARVVPLGGLEPTTPSLRRQWEALQRPILFNGLSHTRTLPSPLSQAAPKLSEDRFFAFALAKCFGPMRPAKVTAPGPTDTSGRQCPIWVENGRSPNPKA